MTRERLAISPEEYHELPAYGSGAMAIYAVEGQLEFWAKCVARIKQRETSSAFDIGQAFHEAMRDPENWRERFVEEPTIIDASWAELCQQVNDEAGCVQKKGKWNKTPATPGARISRRYDTHKKVLELWESKHNHAIILPHHAFATLDGMIASVFDNTEAAQIVSDKSHINVEVAYVLTHDSGVKFKALIDLDQDAVLNDYKTTRHSRMEDFIRFERKRLLHQAGHYCFVTGKRRFRFISVRNEPPYECNVCEVKPGDIAAYTFQAEKRAEELAQLITQSQLDSVDSQGMPLSFHGELWGTVIPFDLEMLEMGIDL